MINFRFRQLALAVENGSKSGTPNRFHFRSLLLHIIWNRFWCPKSSPRKTTTRLSVSLRVVQFVALSKFQFQHPVPRPWGADPGARCRAQGRVRVLTEVTPPNHPAQKKVSRNDPAQDQEKTCWPKFRKKHVDPSSGKSMLTPWEAGSPLVTGCAGTPYFPWRRPGLNALTRGSCDS